MDNLEYWRLCDEMSVIQAALLIVGCDPADYEHVENWNFDKRPMGYEATKTAIGNALRKGTLKGNWIRRSTVDFDGKILEVFDESVDYHSSQVDIASLREWLTTRDRTSNFFFPQAKRGPEYLHPFHDRYAPKLAAAVDAWRAMEGKSLEGRSPKQALMKWLQEHADDYQLLDENGRPNETGIEEIAKVANWQTSGGAPKTPSR